MAAKIVNRLYVDFAETQLSLEAVTFQIYLVSYIQNHCPKEYTDTNKLNTLKEKFIKL